MKKKTSTRKKKKQGTRNKYNNYTVPVGITLYSNNQMNYSNQKQVQVMQPGYPNQQVIPYPGYPPNQGYDQQAPTPQIDYSLIASINQLQHQSIFEAEQNTLFITLGCCFKVLPIILFLCGVACSLSAFSYGFGGYIACGIGIIFLIISIVWGCKNYYSIYFIMGDSALTMIKKALFRRKTKIFRFGELHSIELKEIVAKGKRSFHYVLDVTYTNMSSQTEFHQDSGVPLFTHEEMGFFNYIINRHIQTKMRR